MQKFEIVLKNDKVNIYRRISLFLLILNILVFIFFLFVEEKRKSALASLIIIFLFTAVIFLLKRFKKQLITYGYTFFLLTILWSINNNYWIAGINFIISILYPLAVNKVIYEISAAAVKQQNFPRHKYPWEKFLNVMLKDNMLTLDFKNNKIVQFEIQSPDTFDENEFNAFARRQIDGPAI